MIALLCQANALAGEAQAQNLKALPIVSAPKPAEQSDDLFNSLVLMFQGQPPMPQLE